MRRLASIVALHLCSVALACSGDSVELEEPHVRAPRLVEAALHDDNAWTRAETLRLVGLAGNPGDLPRLVAALDDSDPMVQLAATEALLRRGSDEAENSALSKLVSGAPEMRIQLLQLIIASGSDRFRSEAIDRCLRDPDPTVQIAAIEELASSGVPLPTDSLIRLVEGDNADLAERAFQELVARDRDRAFDFVLRAMRTDSAEDRERALDLARLLAVPELWPAMRSFSRHGTPDEMSLALLVLGHLGDPAVEDELRSLVLTGSSGIAARALSAIANIPTERGRNQPLIHRNDERLEVRQASFAALVAQERPLSDFEPFLQDRDPRLGERALLYMQSRDPAFTGDVLLRTLNTAAEPERVMMALFRASETRNLLALLETGRERFLQLSGSANPTVANLATRLLLKVSPPVEHMLRIAEGGQESSLYALVEASLSAPRGFSDVYARALSSPLFALQVAAAIGIEQLGDDFHPTPPAED